MRDVREEQGEKRHAGGHAMNTGEKMRRVRSQAMLVRRLSEQMKEAAPGRIASPGFDGMPHSRSSMARGLDIQVAKREAMMNLLMQERARLKEYEAQTRREMEHMRPELYAFCALYYLAGLTLAETGEAIDRSERQCERYRREIERQREQGNAAQEEALAEQEKEEKQEEVQEEKRRAEHVGK